ncbi:PREDICTED: zinc finger CCCH domain-containing protein 3 [Fragaria vesca subsp. vesca]|uniref:zinc finger CCCH domain-containing protein 3 n=1 Tax=Fragaria vesca subsp. vesca TaxID=101020 RepID=UPI0002C32866|nr:PREDICTED: zinc finger CCCH domain-containing protein 3 [Fragaria vesca subsp. vesca]
MPDTRQAQKNAAPNQSDGNVEEAFWQLTINENQDGGGVAQSNLYPDRPGEPDCIYYLRTGLCGYGSNCRFNHPKYASQAAQYSGELPERVGQPDCGYYLKTGTCKYGSTCKFHHPRDRRGAGPVLFNVLGLPMHQEEKSCPYYMRTGSCKFGPACKFHHPQPPSLTTALPAFGSTGSSVVPSSGVPYTGGLSAWSFPRAPYVAGPRIATPQPYMPAVVLSPPQGVLPAHGWNTYVGNLSPVSSTSILGSNLTYNSRGQGESASNGQVHLPSSPNLPQRPDQPECRYYMNTGTCKYGAECKYHHPKERIAESATNPLGLPSRPGQPVCSNYIMYGICKYGPTCRFDHPFMEQSGNYSFGMPMLVDPSPLSYPRSWIAPQGFESSPSSISSKFPDQVQKPESEKYQNSETKVPEESPEQAAGTSPPSPSSSETVQDQSG